MFRTLVLIGALLAPLPATAAVIGTFQRDYGSGPGEFDPGTGGRVRDDYIRIHDAPRGDIPGDFFDSFSLASLAGAAIDSVTLTVTHRRANQLGGNNEIWFFNIYGSDPDSFADNAATTLSAGNNSDLFTTSLTISAESDTGSVNAFATAIANQEVRFGFNEVTNGSDNFRIYAAVLTVNGTAAVPIPAPGAMLLMGLGLLAWRRRRQARAAAAA